MSDHELRNSGAWDFLGVLSGFWIQNFVNKNGIDLTRGWSSSVMTRIFGWVSWWARLFVTFTLINAIDRSDPKIDAIVAEFLNLCSELLQGREEIDNFTWHFAGTILSYVTEVGFALLCSPLLSSLTPWFYSNLCVVWGFSQWEWCICLSIRKHIKLRSNSQGGGQTYVWYEV